MNTLKKIALLLAIVFIQFSCRNRLPITPSMKLTSVYVESGSIDGSNFTSNGYFKATDTAIGMLDSTSHCISNYNGYVDKDNYVYLFDDGVIPSKIERLGPYLRYLLFKRARWQNPNNFNYILDFDAEICRNAAANKYFIRLAGNTSREFAKIRGIKVYRFKEHNVLEDYTQILETMKYLKDSAPPINYYNLLNLDPRVYTMTSSRVDFKTNSIGGTIDLDASTFTPIGVVDKITFISNNPKFQDFRFRNVYENFPQSIRDTYFNANGQVINFSNWLNYLDMNILPNHIETIITGYTCNKCDRNTGIRSIGQNPPPGMMP